MNKIEAYKKIIKTITAVSKDVELGSTVTYFKDQLVDVIETDKLSTLFNIPIKSDDSIRGSWVRLCDGITIGKYGKEFNRTISWSEDGRQPKDEWLLVVSFPPGAYIFGQDYQQDTFDQFFNELRAYGTKYVDVVNHCLYFSPEKAKDVYENYLRIYKKYSEIAEYNRKDQKIAELKKQLDLLESV